MVHNATLSKLDAFGLVDIQILVSFMGKPSMMTIPGSGLPATLSLLVGALPSGVTLV